MTRTYAADLVIKAKATDGGNYVPCYYDDFNLAVVHFRKLTGKAAEIELLDNNTGEVLASAVNGVITHEVSFVKEVAQL